MVVLSTINFDYIRLRKKINHLDFLIDYEFEKKNEFSQKLGVWIC